MKKVMSGKINLKKPAQARKPNTNAVRRKKYKTAILPTEPGNGLDDYNLDVMELG